MKKRLICLALVLALLGCCCCVRTPEAEGDRLQVVSPPPYWYPPDGRPTALNLPHWM